MFKDFSFFLVIFFVLSQSYAGNVCVGIFNGNNNVPNSIKYELEKVLLGHNFLSRVDNIREEYKDSLSAGKYTHTVKILKEVEEVRIHPEQFAKTEGETMILQLGFENLVDDLVNISPRVLPTHRIVRENVAVMAALIAKERLKSDPVDVTKSVIQLTPEHVQQNADYVQAKRDAFDLIEAYRDLTQVSREIKKERIDELLFADRRYMLADESLRERLVSFILMKLESQSDIRVENLVNSFFGNQQKTES